MNDRKSPIVDVEIEDFWANKPLNFVATLDKVKGKGSYETSYYICTDHLSLELASNATRKHWHIENQQHWALDVIFKEDEQRIYAGDSALNMACCRRFVQNLFRKSEGSVSVPRKMNKATWDKYYRAKVLFTSA